MARDQTQDPWVKTPYAVKRLVSSEATQIGWLEIKRNNRERTSLEQLTCDGTESVVALPFAEAFQRNPRVLPDGVFWIKNVNNSR